MEGNLENKLPAGDKPGDANPCNRDPGENQKDWFPLFLQFQKMDTAFFEYILTEVENGRQ